MRLPLRSLVLTLFAVLLGAAPPARAEDKDATLARIEAYLNGIPSMTAHFTQAAADGSVGQGKFFLKRPGKLRWEYAPPTPILIVASGGVLYYHDLELEQLSQVPLRDSLMGLLAQEKLDLHKDVTLGEMQESAGLLRLTVRQKGREEEGRLIMVFDPAPLKLRQLDIEDATGQRTLITLENVAYGAELAESLFTVDPAKLRRKKN